MRTTAAARLAYFCAAGFLLLLLISGASTLEAALASKSIQPPFAPDIAQLKTPAGPRAMGSSLTNGADGRVYLSWVESSGTETTILKFSSFDVQTRLWSAARIIAQGTDWFVNWADFPALAVEADGRMTAVWYVNNPAPAPMPGMPGMSESDSTAHAHRGPGYHARVSQSIDGGASWSTPLPLSAESRAVEFVSLLPIGHGQVLAAWLDGRGKKSGGIAEQLYSRVIGGNGPDQLLETSVCDCCQTSLTAFPDGSALLAYRGRTAGEIRDIQTARYADGHWQPERTSTRDLWKIAGCPVNGPQLASSGPRATLAWFTAAGNEPRVLVSSTPDAGGIYTMAQRVDLGRPSGRVDVLLLRDGTQLVSWLEDAGADASQPAGIYLRRFAASGATLKPALIAAGSVAKATGFPRMALATPVNATGPAQLIVAYTRAEDPTQIETLLVTMPSAESLAAADRACDCATAADSSPGFPVRGKIVATSQQQGNVRIAHADLRGLMKAGETNFKVAPETVVTLKTGADVLGRIEERSDGWWLFDVRVLLSAKP